MKIHDRFKAYYDDDSDEDAANRYDDTGSVIPWSVNGNWVFEEISNTSFRKFSIYPFRGRSYVCGYHGDDTCDIVIVDSVSGNKL